jgi:3-oxoadipate enol-lactonase
MGEHHSVEAGGIGQAYRTWGAPAAPPLVLLHALGEDGNDWDNVAPACSPPSIPSASTG